MWIGDRHAIYIDVEIGFHLLVIMKIMRDITAFPHPLKDACMFLPGGIAIQPGIP